MPPAWSATRRRILARDPRCTLGLPGCAGVSTEVDHRDRALGELESNLAGVCGPCHAVKSRREAAAARLQT